MTNPQGGLIAAKKNKQSYPESGVDVKSPTAQDVFMQTVQSFVQPGQYYGYAGMG